MWAFRCSFLLRFRLTCITGSCRQTQSWWMSTNQSTASRLIISSEFKPEKPRWSIKFVETENVCVKTLHFFACNMICSIMSQISPFDPDLFSNNLEKRGMDFWELLRKWRDGIFGSHWEKGGNDERVSYSESAAGQAAAAAAAACALLTVFLDSMLLQHNLHNPLCSRQVFCSIWIKYSGVLQVGILQYWRVGREAGRGINGWEQLCDG